MKKLVVTFSSVFMFFSPVFAADIPRAIQCYRQATNSEDIEKYMSCFSSNPVMIDVNRTVEGYSSIKEWALREIIPQGRSFKHRKILEQSEGYAKTEVKWLSWVVHYYYWWDKKDKIIKMSLQYAN